MIQVLKNILQFCIVRYRSKQFPIYIRNNYKEICVVFYFLSFSKDIFVNKRKQNQWRNTRMQGKKKGFESTNRRK